MAASESQHVLISFCESLLTVIHAMKENAKGDSEKDIVLSLYEGKCQTLCDEIKSSTQDPSDKFSVVKCLQNIAQLVLDVTYVDECTLVDEEFPLQTAWATMRKIIENLNGIEKLAIQAVPSKKPIESIGDEIVECLHWRRGALCYMYCHTLNEEHAPTDYPQHYRQCLEEGVSELLLMLSTRSNPSWLLSGTTDDQKSEVISNDKNASQLFLDGILSDTHMLALMYCGQLCYWHSQAVNAGTLASPASNPALASVLSRFKSDSSRDCSAKVSGTGPSELVSELSDMRVGSPQSEKSISQSSECKGQSTCQDLADIGRMCLSKYVELAQGALSIGGWNTDQAEKGLQYFKNS